MSLCPKFEMRSSNYKSQHPSQQLPLLPAHYILRYSAASAKETTTPTTHQTHRDSYSQGAMRSRPPLNAARCKLGVEVRCGQVAGRCQDYGLFGLSTSSFKSGSQGRCLSEGSKRQLEPSLAPSRRKAATFVLKLSVESGSQVETVATQTTATTPSVVFLSQWLFFFFFPLPIWRPAPATPDAGGKQSTTTSP